jgi:hypothetical protein
LSPGFITVLKGDTMVLSTFVVKGDKHEVAVLAPDGQVAVPTAVWRRGQEYPYVLCGRSGRYLPRELCHPCTNNDRQPFGAAMIG